MSKLFRKIQPEKKEQSEETGKTINLGKKQTTESVSPKQPAQKVYYPSFYVNDISLPVEPDDVGSEIKANVTLILKSIGESTSDSKKETQYNYSFDVKTIEFGT